ncbi:hypothetical protein [Mycobacterium branderi]|uniref:Uncharacterized protein n=1 Tax=Mycobacterium branderi TaxID=43348 RepID=A0ABM7KUX7_9MYCO|nr:hypothetical protein [Mycobacterium branderi]BBZ15030.1 hypothetical protein MBRA_52250 [Mycobacterium branderi]
MYVYAFAYDDRSQLYLQDTGGDENWRLYVLDLKSGKSRAVTPP